jgi:predicted secreted Zn-dependent protease
MIKRIGLFFALLAGAVTPAAAEDTIKLASLNKGLPVLKQSRIVTPTVKETYEYYEIKGDCENDLQSQLRQHGTRWSDGKTYDSVTSWHVTWDYGYDRTADACSADSFKATVEITYRYPRWVGVGDAPGRLVEKWDGYLQNLIKHEEGHRDMAVEASTEFTRAVAALPPAPTCAELDHNVRTLSRAIMKKLNADQKEYDIATCHGATQGAVFH